VVEKRHIISLIINTEAMLCLTSYERELKLEEQEEAQPERNARYEA
jgi:hypothetical protein